MNEREALREYSLTLFTLLVNCMGYYEREDMWRCWRCFVFIADIARLHVESTADDDAVVNACVERALQAARLIQHSIDGRVCVVQARTTPLTGERLVAQYVDDAVAIDFNEITERD